MNSISELAEIIQKLPKQDDVYNFLLEILTESEVTTISKRWRILTMLSDGISQREIASKLNVSLCKVTRGSKILKNKKAIITQHLLKENKQ